MLTYNILKALTCIFDLKYDHGLHKTFYCLVVFVRFQVEKKNNKTFVVKL